MEEAKEKKKKPEITDFYMDTMELERKKSDAGEGYLNTRRNAFLGRFDDGLNSRGSVFDQGALFRTDGGN